MVQPASLHVIHHPDPVLRVKSAPIGEITDEVRAVARRMIELMAYEEGIGLAAPQVGLSWRLFVAHVPEDAEEGRSANATPPTPLTATLAPVVYINPELSGFEGAAEPFAEGCLSLPDIRGSVLRPPTVSITATDLNGARFNQRATGLLARCWQHEVDHLDGILIIDRMIQPDRLKNRAKLRAMERGE